MKLFDVYSLYPVEPVRGSGSYVYDAAGTEYLDLYGGHAVISIGHAHPHYVRMISEQAARLGFYSNSVENSLQHTLAERLGALSGYDDYRLFLCNSGAEANENALKLASFHTGRAKVLAFGGAFHGRTSGAVEVTDNPAIRSPFNATANVEFVPLNDIGAVERKLAAREFAAVIVEGIQGVAGIRCPEEGFLRALREATERTGTVLILDEIQSGYGRTGRFFAHQWAGIRPDLITTAKGMGNGFPIGGVLIAPQFEARKGMLGTTFGGNHLACAAAIAVADTIAAEGLVENARRVGDRLLERLRTLPALHDVRGRGLMIGFDVEGSASELRRRLVFEQHVFTGGAGAHTVRLLPALGLSEAQADEFVARLKALLEDFREKTDTTMRKFTCVADIGDLAAAVAEALEVKRDRFAYQHLGRNKTLLMIFFNSSLRTRLSTQKAAMNLGMNVMVLDVNQGAWKLETERGVVMDGDKAEHLLEAIPVMGSYCDLIGVRSFARFQDKTEDYEERVLEQFIRYSGRPVFSMEAATRHPLQSFADLITIEEHKRTARPKVVMTWAPHPNALPQAVPNSFAEWMNAADYDFVIAHPEGYELDPRFVGGARVEHDQRRALEGADFVYAKNWAAYADPNYGRVLSRDREWTVDAEKMALTNDAFFMHCLPVRRNMIVTDEVIESPRSLVIPEAANREISAQVVLKRLLEGLE